jgi:hypothetical protein
MNDSPSALDTPYTGTPATADDYTGTVNGLTVTQNPDGSVTLNWTYAGEAAQAPTVSFETEAVDQDAPGTNYAPIFAPGVSNSGGAYAAQVGAGNLIAGDTFSFRVRADNPDGTVSDWATVGFTDPHPADAGGSGGGSIYTGPSGSFGPPLPALNLQTNPNVTDAHGNPIITWQVPSVASDCWVSFYAVEKNAQTGQPQAVLLTPDGPGITQGTWTAGYPLPVGLDTIFAVYYLNDHDGATQYGYSPVSNMLQVDNEPIPAAPEAISAVVDPNDDTQVDIHWNNNAGSQSEYILQRTLKSGIFRTIATLPADVTSYVDSINSTTLDDLSATYQVVAANSSGQSTPTASAAVTGISPANGPHLQSVYPKVVAEFSGASATKSVDQYPGAAGSGWAGPWTVEPSVPKHKVNSTIASTVIDSNQLLGNGNYLSTTINSTSAHRSAAVSRNYTGGSKVGGTPVITATSPQNISFLYRFDGISGGDVNSSDQLTLFGNNQAKTGTSSTDTWEATARIPRNSHVAGGDWTFGGWDSKVPLYENDVYAFTINLDPSSGYYQVEVHDMSKSIGGNPPADAKSVNPIAVRDTAATSSSFVEFGMTLGSGKAGTFSLDNVVIEKGTAIVPPTAPPVIKTNPTSTPDLLIGKNATFTAAAADQFSSVQWQVSDDGGQNFTNIAGQTGESLTLSSVTLAQSGYMYRAVFTNAYGATATAPATLNIAIPRGLVPLSPVSNGGDNTTSINDALTSISNNGGGTLVLGAGNFPISGNLTVYPNTTIEGAASFGTELIFNNLSTDQHDPYGIVLEPASGQDSVDDVTLSGLNISSNLGDIEMASDSAKSGYQSINIEDNVFSAGNGFASQRGSSIFGIWNTAYGIQQDNSHINVKYNDFVNVSSDRAVEASGDVNSHFDYNLFTNVNAGVHLYNPGSDCSFNFNYGTGLHDKALETAMADATNFEAEGNVFYDWSSPRDNSYGLSVVETTDTKNNVPTLTIQASGQPIYVTHNYIDINAVGGIFGLNLDGSQAYGSGYAYEVGGYPLDFSNNIAGVTMTPSALGADYGSIVVVCTKDAGSLGSGGNTFFGQQGAGAGSPAIQPEPSPLPNPDGPIDPVTGQPEQKGNWVGPVVYPEPLSQISDEPANTFAGNLFYGSNSPEPPDGPQQQG